MSDAIVHRGPDDWGIWTDDEAGIGFAQRRLSIIDLSPQGHQPMVSFSGRWVLSFNGEIYNFAELRNLLEQSGTSPAWRGHSDTEVLLACVEAWGVEKTLRSTVGMFAISLWDRERRVLILARDRMGEKPLYYGRIRDRLLFGSELKALRAVANSELEIDSEALGEFLRFSYVPAPRSIWKNIRKLPPGHWLELGYSDDVDNAPKAYWKLGGDAHDSLVSRLTKVSDVELAHELETRLTESVRLQMVADVPLGAFLSGGVDSSLVVALMQRQSSRPVRTFTIGFDQPEFNEAPFAMEVARHLGTDHTELYITAKDAEEVIPRLPFIYDEPFADSSQIPTTLVSHLTSQHVTVSLSGDGGDELFAGYPRYALTTSLWHRVNRLPLRLRQAASSFLRAPSAAAWDRALGVAPSRIKQSVNGRRMHRLSQMLVAQSLGEMYVRLMSQWQPEEEIVVGLQQKTFSLGHWDEELGSIEAMRRWDARQYLPDDLLVKVDRASMSASLEARAPMLDHRVVELAFAMPERSLSRDGLGKWPLRSVLYRHVPKHLIERPKRGFSVPLAEWIRGPLRGWSEDLLSEDRLRREGLLRPEPVRALWREHLAGKFDRSSYLWNILMFQAWNQH